MQSPINKDNIELFAHTNEELLKGAKPKSLVVEFHGLGGGLDMLTDQWPLARILAEQEALYILPYYGPWCWMNDSSVKYVDEVIDAVIEHFGLDGDIPIVSSGYSMGGQGALVYARYAKRTPVAVAALSPVCDLLYHFTERPDVARTVYSSYAHFDMPYEEAIKLRSPVHLVDSMPDIKYAVFHADKDGAVHKDKHSDVFVGKMKALGRDVDYYEFKGLGHCELTDEGREIYHNFVKSFGR